MIEYMGQNYQDGKYAFFVSLFVRFQRDLESKWAIGEPRKKFPVDKCNKESNDIFCKLAQLKQLTINDLWKGKQNILIVSPLFKTNIFICYVKLSCQKGSFKAPFGEKNIPVLSPMYEKSG